MAKQPKRKKSGLKPGDQVMMHSCYEARKEKYKDKVWTVDSESWDLCGSEVIRLEGYSGGFATEFLKKVELHAVAIGPDRTEIVVGHEPNEALAAWYREYHNIPEDEWKDYKVSDFPMDKKLEWEDEGGMTLREMIRGMSEFPGVVGFQD